MQKNLRCYAVGRVGEWEAHCLDLDIAVQGDSFPAVRNALNVSIDLYFETLMNLPEADQARLANRRAPATEWIKYYMVVLFSKLRARHNHDHSQPFTLQHA